MRAASVALERQCSSEEVQGRGQESAEPLVTRSFSLPLQDELGPGARAVHFPLVFFLASKTPPWTSFSGIFSPRTGFLGTE